MEWLIAAGRRQTWSARIRECQLLNVTRSLWSAFHSVVIHDMDLSRTFMIAAVVHAVAAIRTNVVCCADRSHKYEAKATPLCRFHQPGNS